MNITNKSTVELIDHMGTDLTVVNAARVSFNKESILDVVGNLQEKDAKLIKYLASHNHWSPFAHTSIQLRVSSPVFVARQLVKHQIGGVWNEVSRRYVDDEPVFYFPNKWRKRAENVKQGSSDEVYTGSNFLYDQTADCLWAYNVAIKEGMAPEQARMILPQNMMTSWYWTGSLMFFNRVYKQRTDPHAQEESRQVAVEIGKVCKKLFPVSWEALTDE